MRAVLIRLLLSASLVLSLVPCAYAPAAAAVTAESQSAGATVASVDEDADYIEGELIITYDDAPDDASSARAAAEATAEATEALEDAGIEVEETLAEADEGYGSIVCATYDTDEGIEQAMAAAATAEGVASVEPNYVLELAEEVAESDEAQAEALPDDPAASVYSSSKSANQYYLYGDLLESASVKGANVIDAWDEVACEGDVTIVVMDTGVNLEHEDLADNLLEEYCYDFYNDEQLEATDDFCGDYSGHGTHVAGIAAGVAGNATGIAGVSYNANLIMYKVFDDSSSSASASIETVIDAYTQLLELVEEEPELNIRVVNLSLGYYPDSSPSSAFEAVIEKARDAGVLTVCAGGNGDSSGNPLTDAFYPSDYESVLSVTALRANGTNATWSDFNAAKDISAPGVSIYSTLRTSISSYGKMSGTSMASPLVAAVAALLFAANPDATVDEVFEAITSTADDVDDSSDSYARNSTGTGGVVSGSAGAIDAAAAVAAIAEATIELPSGTETVYRTQSVQLSAALKASTGEQASALTWSWSEEDGTGEATIDASTGVLTARAVGDVTVTATAASAAEEGKTYVAELVIDIEELALESDAGPQASAAYGATSVSVTWGEQSAASGYYVQRADYGSSAFATIATLASSEADESGTLTYADTDVSVGSVYQYQIVPYGLLDGEVVLGTASDVCCGACFALVSSYATQSAIAAQLVALAAVEGTSIDTVFVVGQDDTPEALAAYAAAGAYGAAVVTVGTSALDDDAQAALELYDPDKVYVVGSTSVIKRAVVTAIKTALPSATTKRYSEDTLAELSCTFYDLCEDSYGSTAFVIGDDEDAYEDMLSLGAYAYAQPAAVFVTDTDGELSEDELACIEGGVISRVVVIGDEEAVGTDVETQLGDLGMTYARICGETPYATSVTLAQQGDARGVFWPDVYYFAPADATTCLQGSALAGYSGCALLLIGDEAEEALADYVTQGSAESYTPVAYFGTDTSAISDEEQERILGYVQGDESVIAVKSTQVSMAHVTAEPIEDVSYTGSALEPALTLTYEDETLVEGTDYTVAYTDNVEVGTATATATGMDTYAGTLSVTFEILATPLSDAVITLDDADDCVYDGTAHTPDIVSVVLADGTQLEPNEDYTAAYSDNVNAGTATITITGQGAYAGNTTVTTFEIYPAGVEEPVVVSGLVYTGEEQTGVASTAAASVCTVTGGSAVDAGSYTATAALVDTENYVWAESGTTESLTYGWSIEAADVEDVEVEAIANVTYTGSALEPGVQASFCGMELAEGTDYTLAYADNVNAGTATVTMSGTGNYTGTRAEAFEIEARDMSGASVTLSQTSYTYTGSKLVPDVTVTLDSVTLAISTDYTVSYADNVDAGTATVTVSGTGNYTGAAGASFTIAAASIATATMQDIGAQAYTGSAICPELYLYNGTTRLEEGVDYTVSFGSNVEIGSVIVAVSGIGNWTGSFLTAFSIVQASLAEAELTLSQESYTYSGAACEPDVTVTLGGVELAEGTDYELAYADNVNAGAATVTATGLGNYTGTATTTFAIAKARLTRVKLAAASYTYNGKKRTPVVTVYDASGAKLAAGSDYTVVYASGRKAIGSYKVTVKGAGNYTGSFSGTFKIVPGKVTVKSVKAGKKGTRKLTAKWKKLSGGVSYQIAYKAKGGKWKYAKVSGKKASKVLGKLKRGKKYTVKVRACKKASGKTYYGSWSKSKTVKVK